MLQKKAHFNHKLKKKQIKENSLKQILKFEEAVLKQAKHPPAVLACPYGHQFKFQLLRF